MNETIRTSGTVINARTSGDVLHLLLRPSEGKKIIAVGVCPTDSLGKRRKPRLNSFVEIRGTFASEGSTTIVVTGCQLEV